MKTPDPDGLSSVNESFLVCRQVFEEGTDTRSSLHSSLCALTGNTNSPSLAALPGARREERTVTK